MAVLYSSLQKREITTFSKNHQKTKIPDLARMRGAAGTQKGRVRGATQIGRVIQFFAKTENYNFFEKPSKNKEPYTRAHAGCRKGRVPEEGEIGRVIGIFHFLHAL